MKPTECYCGPLPTIDGKKITRDDVITSLFELRDIAYAYERSKDPSFRRFPDLEKILEHLAVHGLEPADAHYDQRTSRHFPHTAYDAPRIEQPTSDNSPINIPSC